MLSETFQFLIVLASAKWQNLVNIDLGWVAFLILIHRDETFLSLESFSRLDGRVDLRQLTFLLLVCRLLNFLKQIVFNCIEFTWKKSDWLLDEL